MPSGAHNPIGEEKPVYVHEEVTVEKELATGYTTNVIKYPKGSMISIAEAKALGVPLLDADGKKIAGQRAKKDVETQDVKGPRRKR